MKSQWPITLRKCLPQGSIKTLEQPLWTLALWDRTVWLRQRKWHSQTCHILYNIEYCYSKSTLPITPSLKLKQQ